MNGNVDLHVVGIDHRYLCHDLAEALAGNRLLSRSLFLESTDRFSGFRLQLERVEVRRMSRRGDALVAVVHDKNRDTWVRLHIPDDTAHPILARGAFGELSTS